MTSRCLHVARALLTLIDELQRIIANVDSPLPLRAQRLHTAMVSLGTGLIITCALSAVCELPGSWSGQQWRVQ